MANTPKKTMRRVAGTLVGAYGRARGLVDLSKKGSFPVDPSGPTTSEPPLFPAVAPDKTVRRAEKLTGISDDVGPAATNSARGRHGLQGS
jgi:hypothetical protein